MASKVIHPGRVLQNKIELGKLSANAVANKLGITPRKLFDILACRRPITIELAHKLVKIYPDTTAKYWTLLQVDYDLWDANRRLDTLEETDKEKELLDGLGGNNRGDNKKDVGVQEHPVQESRDGKASGLQKGKPRGKVRAPL